VYLLETSTDSDLILVRSTEPDSNGLIEWWRILDEHLVTDLSRISATTRVRSCPWPLVARRHLVNAERTVGPLLAASVKLLEIAVEANLRPILCSSLLWISKEGWFRSMCVAKRVSGSSLA